MQYFAKPLTLDRLVGLSAAMARSVAASARQSSGMHVDSLVLAREVWAAYVLASAIKRALMWSVMWRACEATSMRQAELQWQPSCLNIVFTTSIMAHLS